MVKRVCTTAEELLEDAPRNSKKSRNVAFLSDLFERKDNISHLMCRSSLFKEAGKADESPAESDEERQQSAKLHVLYGCSIEPSEEDMDRMLARAIHPYARSRVYDLRRYKRSNFWGPFMDDHSQRVDWEKVQAILIDLNYNLQVLSDRTDGQFSLLWDKPFEGLTQDSFSSRPLPCLKQAPTPLDAEDPYGVTGTWMRIVCFLDYTHLFTFNFESEMIPADQEREPICTEEAIRLIFLKLRVTSVEPAGEDDMQGTVVTHFTGSSRSMHMSWDPNANSRIRGSVIVSCGRSSTDKCQVLFGQLPAVRCAGRPSPSITARNDGVVKGFSLEAVGRRVASWVLGLTGDTQHAARLVLRHFGS